MLQETNRREGEDGERTQKKGKKRVVCVLMSALVTSLQPILPLGGGSVWRFGVEGGGGDLVVMKGITGPSSALGGECGCGWATPEKHAGGLQLAAPLLTHGCCHPPPHPPEKKQGACSLAAPPPHPWLLPPTPHPTHLKKGGLLQPAEGLLHSAASCPSSRGCQTTAPRLVRPPSIAATPPCLGVRARRGCGWWGWGEGGC